MSEYELKDAIDEHMPIIDERLQELETPIFERLMHAAMMFVDVAIVSSSFETTEDLVRSQAFFERIIPPVRDWYWNKYGQLSVNPRNRNLSGIVSLHGQPVSINFPSRTSRVEIPSETAWLIFPDCLQEDESWIDMIQMPLEINKIEKTEITKLLSELNEVVSMSRTINLNIMTASGLDTEATDMAQGIWAHFEKAVSDILSFKVQQASIGCWELHLAIEKTLKVILKQKSGKRHTGHNLINLGDKLKSFIPEIDLSSLKTLPSEGDAIKMRYAELVTSMKMAVNYYKKALILVSTITNQLNRKYRLNNARILLKKVPWAR